MDVVIVGIDVAKDKLDVGVRPSGERFVVSRTETGLEELTDRLRELGVAVVGLEATGGYETVVAASLSAAGLPVVVVNPAQVRAFANALGKRAKTDPIDVPPCYHPGAARGMARRAQFGIDRRRSLARGSSAPRQLRRNRSSPVRAVENVGASRRLWPQIATRL